MFKRTIKRSSNGRHAVQPLFKKDCVPLKNNYYLSMIRFKTLRRSLRKNPNKANTYNTEMKKLLDDGKIEEITGPTKDDKNMDRNIYYLPHSCVVKEERVTTKVRMVFDASA